MNSVEVTLWSGLACEWRAYNWRHGDRSSWTICVRSRCSYFYCETWHVLSVFCVMLSYGKSAIVELQEVAFIADHSLQRKFLSHCTCVRRVNWGVMRCELLAGQKTKNCFECSRCACSVVIPVPPFTQNVTTGGSSAEELYFPFSSCRHWCSWYSPSVFATTGSF